MSRSARLVKGLTAQARSDRFLSSRRLATVWLPQRSDYGEIIGSQYYVSVDPSLLFEELA